MHALTEETIRKIDRGKILLDWIMPRLAGGDDEVETTLVMLFAHLHDRYVEGIHDASVIADRLSAAKPASRDLATVSWALRELEARHRKHEVTAL